MWEEEEKQGMEHRKLPRVTSDEGTEDNRSTRFARAQRERERERGHEDSTQCRSHSIAQCYEEWAVLTPNY